MFSLKKIIKLIACHITGTLAINFLYAITPVQSQITPDNTLPTNSSVNTNNQIINITGGTVVGTGQNVNLYHSFTQFSVPANQTAYFNNTINVTNIITRITGSEKSIIDGTIQANGNANLFIINPHGIRFGNNAQLNIGGSFLASSAEAIKLADGTIFSAKNPQNTPLLTMSVPTGLQFGDTPGTIENLSTVSGVGLQVPTGKTLALVGGDVILDGGLMSVDQGRIEVGGVGKSGEVKIIPTNDDGFTLNYDQVQNFANISLINAAKINPTEQKIKNIEIQGKNLTINDTSSIVTVTPDSNTGGNIDIKTTESLKMQGDSYIITETDGSGKAGDININTQNLLLENGAQIGAISTSEGQGGNLTVKADTIQIFGVSQTDPNNIQFTQLFAQTLGTGNGGNLTVITNNLLLQDGGQLNISSFGDGQGGILDITAKSVQLIGTFNNGQFSSGLLANAQSTGSGGKLILNTENLTIENGAQIATVVFDEGQGGDMNINVSKLINISGTTDNEIIPSGIFATTRSSGNAGNLTINTPQLIITNGGQVGASTRSSGKGGNLNITATQSLDISGKSNQGKLFSVLSVRSFAGGDAGNLIINSPIINISDEAIVTAQGLGLGNAGTLTIKSNFLTINNKGVITASTNSGEGGNIDLNVNNLLLMRNQSLISATAGGSGNGGNIKIKAPFLIAIDPENSDIFANAFKGRGGHIDITTNGIFGLEFRAKPTPLSDITASSEFGLNGTVQINTPGVDPTQGIVQLSSQVVDISGLVEKGCNGHSTINNSFTVTGKGGLPDNPLEISDPQVIVVDLGEQTSTKQSILPEKNIYQSQQKLPQLIESQGWIINSKGEIVLTANNPDVTPHNSGFKSLSCGGN